jgi:flavin reductase (DIM6/NTAB) family NADH-FMN oxidoreductase RutF
VIPVAEDQSGSDIVSIDESPFERAFAAYSVVLVGTLEEDGDPNLAPKHMVTPMGWDGYYGFACSPEHSTTDNIKRTGEFTVTYPRPEQIVSVSLSAEPRDEDDEKPDLDQLEMMDAVSVEAPLVDNAYIYLECKLDRIISDLGENNFVVGEIVDQHVHADVLRDPDKDDADLIREHPILAYLHPGRYAEIDYSQAFPFPRNFSR